MANNFLTTQQIAREALMRLRNQLVMTSLMHRDHSQDFGNQGETILIRKPATFTANEFNGNVTAQDVNESSVPVTLDKIADVTVEVSSKQMSLDVQNFSEQIIVPAMQAIAQKIDADAMQLYKDVYTHAGVSGITPNSLDDFANARKLLNKNQAPFDNRAAVWSPDAEAKFAVIPAIVNAEKSGSTDALLDGSIGKVFGLGNHMSQNILTHVAGAYTTLEDVTADGAAGASTVKLTSAAGSSNASLKKGDLVVIDGYQYTVTADTAAAAAGIINAVAIAPALRANAAGATVVFPDATAGGHVANLAFHKNAFCFVNRPIALPVGGATGYQTSFEGLSIRVTNGYDLATKKNMMSFDILYGFKAMQPELAVRYLG